ncbi:hypothetical protein ACFLZZ_03435 [Nanoarchaeota archaeon]
MVKTKTKKKGAGGLESKLESFISKTILDSKDAFFKFENRKGTTYILKGNGFEEFSVRLEGDTKFTTMGVYYEGMPITRITRNKVTAKYNPDADDNEGRINLYLLDGEIIDYDPAKFQKAVKEFTDISSKYVAKKIKSRSY